MSAPFTIQTTNERATMSKLQNDGEFADEVEEDVQVFDPQDALEQFPEPETDIDHKADPETDVEPDELAVPVEDDDDEDEPDDESLTGVDRSEYDDETPEV